MTDMTPYINPLASLRGTPGFEHKMAEAQKFINDLARGKYTRRDFQEKMSTSDFPLLLGANLERQMLGYYQATPASWPTWAREVKVNDFNEMKLLHLDGGDGRLEKKRELAERRVDTLDEGEYKIAVEEYSREIALSFQMLVNDRLDAFADIPRRFGVAARRTEEHLATTMIADANGPHATLFTADRGNLITDPLSHDGLNAAYTAMRTMTDPGGEPIFNRPTTLAVVPALEPVAKHLLSATEIRQIVDTVTTIGTNPYANLKLEVLEYGPTVMKTANHDTSWFLFADPKATTGIAAVGKLIGYEEPGIFRKTPDAMRADGSVDIVDFQGAQMKQMVRHIIGATPLDYRMGVGSTGAGS